MGQRTGAAGKRTGARDRDIGAWYARALGWDAAGRPPRLRTGVRFDVLDVPAAAGHAVLRRFSGAGATGPAALHGGRVLLLVAAGTAEELPGLLEWLDWGGIHLDLRVSGAGGRMLAPWPPGRAAAPRAEGAARPVWLRAPEPGRDIEPTLPALSVVAGTGAAGPVGLVPLVGAVATECHRARLLSARRDQPCAFSYASRMLAGTRPRSLTS